MSRGVDPGGSSIGVRAGVARPESNPIGARGSEPEGTGSAPLRCSLDLLISVIQLGCVTGLAATTGDSGLDKALSSQLDF